MCIPTRKKLESPILNNEKIFKMTQETKYNKRGQK